MIDFAKLRFVFSETFSTIGAPTTVFIWITCVVVATVAGPFGTFLGMDLLERAFYWGLVTTGGILFGYAMYATALMILGEKHPFLFDPFVAFLIAVILGPMIWLLRTSLQPDAPTGLINLRGVVFNTFVISFGVLALRRQICRLTPVPLRSGLRDTLGANTFPGPRLLRRLEEDVRAPVLRLSANDHYVDVVTTRGAQILRLRLSDAIDEMEPAEGCCVHRSHWVARDAIERVERENAHKMFLLLKNGDRVPVSRTYRGNLEDMGIISQQAQNGVMVAGRN